jgi:integrase
MSYTINKLFAIKVRSVTRPGMYGDGAGLWLQVSCRGSKSWILRYDFCGRRREMGLGSCHTVDLALALAREKAKACRLVLLEKRDPIEERDKARAEYVRQQAKRVNFDECASACVGAHRGSWTSVKHAAQWETTLAMYASPVISALPVADVDTALVVKVLKPTWTTKTETATRLRGRIESILDWATTHKFRRDENPARWRGHLENLLANPNKIAPVKNHPALPWREIGAFMTELRKREGVSARAIEFAILTACRSGEVRGARWSEIDLDAKLWTIPAERMKEGKEHRVPLSTSAMAILGVMERRGDYVFPGRDKAAVLSDMSLTAVLRRMERSDITMHGFRSTFRDWRAEYGGNSFSREVCEHALAHGLPDKVEAAYRRGDLLDKRIVLMQKWGDYCALQSKDV